MTLESPRRNPPAVQPTYLIDEAQVNDAYAAYTAMQKAAQRDPALLQNDYFKALQDTGYARFLATFRALPDARKGGY